MKIPSLCFVLAILFAGTASAEVETETLWRIYIGTYSNSDDGGIHLLEMDKTTGALHSHGVVASVKNPSFLAAHPRENFLYCVGRKSTLETAEDGVSAFAVETNDGSLRLLNQQPVHGSGPCHLTVDPQGRHLFVANYNSGSVNVFPLNKDASLGTISDWKQHVGSGTHPSRQDGPHAHSANLDPAGQILIAADLGLDKLMLYHYDPEKGLLHTHDPDAAATPAGAGPRHVVFHPSGTILYVVNELDNTLIAYNYNPSATKPEAFQYISTLPDNFTGSNTTAEIRIHPSGRFLYASNRGHDSIACFSITPITGRLQALGHHHTGGKEPRNFNISPDGAFMVVANQNSNTVVAFSINEETGLPEAEKSRVEVPAPVCVLFYNAR